MADDSESGHHNFEELKKVVIEHSRNKTWEDAKKEWFHSTIFYEESNCICGMKIKQNCVIENRFNAQELVVGNVCVNKFNEDALTIDLKVHKSLGKVVAKLDGQHANDALINVAQRLSILSEKEANWYRNHNKGKGKKVRFDKSNPAYDEEAFKLRHKYNLLIYWGFNKSRPKCKCVPVKYAKPRQNKDGSLFYSCSSWPNGCKFHTNVPKQG